VSYLICNYTTESAIGPSFLWWPFLYPKISILLNGIPSKNFRERQTGRNKMQLCYRAFLHFTFGKLSGFLTFPDKFETVPVRQTAGRISGFVPHNFPAITQPLTTPET
jgi:hypothetical protein